MILINGQQYVIITPNKSDPLDIEPLIINIRHICQQIDTNDRKSVIHQMLKCQ
jgi:hypothetical protein